MSDCTCKSDPTITCIHHPLESVIAHQQAEIEKWIREFNHSQKLLDRLSERLPKKDAEIERLNARLATVQKQADDMVAKHSVLTDNVLSCNAVINDNARARQRLESVIDEYKAEVVFLRGQMEA